MGQKTNIHIIPSNIVNATRLFKQTETIGKTGNFNKIILLGIWNKNLPEKESLKDGKRIIYRLKLFKDRFRAGNIFWKAQILVSMIQYRFKIIYFLNRYRPGYVNCHHIILLPVCVYGKALFNYKLIYDPHELETEVDGLWGLKKKYLKFTERLFIRYTDEVVVVGEKIAEWYRKEYCIDNVHVIRNFPYRHQPVKTELQSPLRQEFFISNDCLLFIYNGFLTSGRGIEIILEAFSRLTGKHHVVFMAYGPLAALVKEYGLRYNNIHFKTAVAPADVIKYTQGADVGLILIQNTCLSYYYSLPNKLFEYIQAGIPALISDFPEMGAIVKKYNCGWEIYPQADILKDFIEHLSKTDVLKKQNEMQKAQDELCWENESRQYEKLFY